VRYFLVYTKSGCRYCERALELLHREREEYVVHDLGESDTQINEAKELHGWPSMPIVLLREGKENRLIGGYTDLEKFISAEAGDFDKNVKNQ
jgi:glutaredoxin